MPGTCLKCGYEIDKACGHCPECGSHLLADVAAGNVLKNARVRRRWRRFSLFAQIAVVPAGVVTYHVVTGTGWGLILAVILLVYAVPGCALLAIDVSLQTSLTELHMVPRLSDRERLVSWLVWLGVAGYGVYWLRILVLSLL